MMACWARLQIVALLVVGLGLAPAAQAQHHRGGYGGGRHGGHGGDATAAIIAGIVGLGLGAAIAGASQPPAYAPPPVYYPSPGYYTPPPPAAYYGAPSYSVPAAPLYAPPTGPGSADELNRQELNRLQAAPAYPPPRY